MITIISKWSFFSEVKPRFPPLSSVYPNIYQIIFGFGYMQEKHFIDLIDKTGQRKVLFPCAEPEIVVRVKVK